MRTIRISDEVWNSIVAMGKFGETPDDVLRRAFKISQGGNPAGKFRVRNATQRMTAKAKDNRLTVSFLNGPSKEWPLPERDDKPGIRSVRDKAVQFAVDNGATIGQQYAVRKALTEAGYHLTK